MNGIGDLGRRGGISRFHAAIKEFFFGHLCLLNPKTVGSKTAVAACTDRRRADDLAFACKNFNAALVQFLTAPARPVRAHPSRCERDCGRWPVVFQTPSTRHPDLICAERLLITRKPTPTSGGDHVANASERWVIDCRSTTPDARGVPLRPLPVNRRLVSTTASSGQKACDKPNFWSLFRKCKPGCATQPGDCPHY